MSALLIRYQRQPELLLPSLAPALEKTLHDHLERYRINRINLRKEFFRVDLSKIINEVERHHGRVEYIADPMALQYLQSLDYAESEAA